MRVITVFASFDEASGFRIKSVEVWRRLREVTVVQTERWWILQSPGSAQIVTQRQANGISLMMSEVKQVFGRWPGYPLRAANQRRAIDIPAQLREYIGTDDRIVCQVDKMKHELSSGFSG